MATPSAWRSRPRRRASVSTARRSLAPSTSTTPRNCIPARSASVRVLVLPPRTGLGGLGFRRSVEQEVVIGRDERVGRHHRVGVVDGPVLARERYPARTLAQPVFQL